MRPTDGQPDDGRLRTYQRPGDDRLFVRMRCATADEAATWVWESSRPGEDLEYRVWREGDGWVAMVPLDAEVGLTLDGGN